MKNTKKIALFAVINFALLLGSCGDTNTPTTSSSQSSSSSSSSTSSSKGGSSSSFKADLTNDDLPKGATEFVDAEGKTEKLTRSRLYQNEGLPHVNSYPTTGKKQKLLVAPIKFTKDTTDSNDTIDANDALLDKIRVTFTGTKEETDAVGGNISVQEFYSQSSFGKGAFDVVMIPTWIDFGMTAKKYQESTSTAGATAAEKVRSWYLAEYNKENHGALGEDAYSLDDLDSDDDGFIDLIWNVYAYPYAQNDTSFWWAYVTYTGNAAGNLKTPNVQTLAWASTNFMSEGANGYESRTFIHETGHTLGLDDYYDYNKQWSPCGGIDYMDQNVGDHNSYSKFACGWVNPWILKEEDLKGGKVAEITLNDASRTGDCLILASPNYNNTAFDEYLMVELVGPYGLCKSDYTNKYGFTVPGIRVWHIDARAMTTDYSKEEVFSTPDEVGQKAYDVRNDNSKFGRGKNGDYWTVEKGSVKRSYAQITILEAGYTDGDNTQTSATKKADNNSLFKKNGTFALAGTEGAKDRAKVFMPSQTNLWNKAKVITNANKTSQKYKVDQTMTINYKMQVRNIVANADGSGATATLRISLI